MVNYACENCGIRIETDGEPGTREECPACGHVNVIAQATLTPAGEAVEVREEAQAEAQAREEAAAEQARIQSLYQGPAPRYHNIEVAAKLIRVIGYVALCMAGVALFAFFVALVHSDGAFVATSLGSALALGWRGLSTSSWEICCYASETQRSTPFTLPRDSMRRLRPQKSYPTAPPGPERLRGSSDGVRPIGVLPKPSKTTLVFVVRALARIVRPRRRHKDTA